MWKMQGSIKKEVEFPGELKKSCGKFPLALPLVLVFYLGIPKGCRTILQGVFRKVYHLQPRTLSPGWIFSGIYNPPPPYIQ